MNLLGKIYDAIAKRQQVRDGTNNQPSSEIEAVHDNHPPQVLVGEEPDLDDTAILRHRLESLPQELYDEIFSLTFTIVPGIRLITNDYRVPAELQVDHATRHRLSEPYFSQGSIFRVDLDATGLRKWVQGFQDTILQRVKVIELPYDYLDDVGEGNLDVLKQAICMSALRAMGSLTIIERHDERDKVDALKCILRLVHTAKRTVADDYTDPEIRPARRRGDSEVGGAGGSG